MRRFDMEIDPRLRRDGSSIWIDPPVVGAMLVGLCWPLETRVQHL